MDSWISIAETAEGETVSDERAEVQRLNPWQGVHEKIFSDTTDELDIEGGLDSGKTTLLLDKEISFLKNDPGIYIFLSRYSDTDVRTKLRPAFEQVLEIRGITDYEWDRDELVYNFPNGSKAWAYGILSSSGERRYGKLRGLGVSRIYIDQAEELPGDIAEELRLRLRQHGHRHQITFSPNPTHFTHWLADRKGGGFPVDNSIPGRRYYALSIYDNAYNLPAETITRAERTYPVTHPKHKMVILGQRGPNIFGKPVYADAFRRNLHMRPMTIKPGAKLIEAFDIWKHHLCWVLAERPYDGGLHCHGGILGENLFLPDFLQIVKQHRAAWCKDAASVETCCTATSKQDDPTRFSPISILKRAQFNPKWRDNGAEPDIVLAMIHQIAGYMRRRSASGDESFAVNNDESRWLRATRESAEACPFLDEALEGGYVWNPNEVSLGSQAMVQPKADDWFEHGMHCVEALELNFGADQPTDADAAARKKAQAKQLEPASGESRYGWMGA